MKFNPNQLKMTTFKLMILTQMIPKKEVEKLYGCDYEFTVEDNMITMLEIWHNPKGKHNYQNKFRKEFKIKPISVSVISN